MVSLLLSCPGGCPNGSHFHDRQASNPCDATKQEFEIRWNITAEDTEIEFVSLTIIYVYFINETKYRYFKKYPL
jgi:hypothetical protein